MANPAPGAHDPDAADLIRRRHPEWVENQVRWRWLMDSLEGGDRYRQAIYGYDHKGQPVRNLVRHKHEYPDPREAPTQGYTPVAATYGVGEDPLATATDDDYELRRARTPSPLIVKEAISDHLDRVQARKVKRAGPAALTAWWDDVDGSGTPVDDWMAEAVAPALLACGQIDIYLDHPRAPEGAEIHSRADAAAAGVDRCVARVILPENLVWWRLDAAGCRYAECLVREYPDGDDLNGMAQATSVGLSAPPSPAPISAPGAVPDDANYRHWTATESVLYGQREAKDKQGRVVVETVELERVPHAFGRVPIARVFARRKTRCRNVGQSDYEGVAEHQREYYNRSSELVLSDTLQAHPLVEGPEDFIQADGTIPVGPSWLLPKKKNDQGGSVSYEGFAFVDPPKGAADSIRQNMHELRDEADRDAALAKPAGTGGLKGSTVSQSGYSKSIDCEKLNNKLCRIANALAKAERVVAELALAVLGDGPPPPGAVKSIEVSYSNQFDLTEVEDLGSFVARILEIAAAPAAGLLPEIAGEHLRLMVRQSLPGRPDDDYAKWDAEIAAAIGKAVDGLASGRGAIPAPPTAMTAQTAPAQGTAQSQTPLDPRAAASPPPAPTASAPPPKGAK